MTFSVPSFLAAATSLLMPPPAAAVVTVAQLAPPLALDGELDDEQPATSNASAPTPASANRCGDLTRCLLSASHRGYGVQETARHGDVRKWTDPPRQTA